MAGARLGRGIRLLLSSLCLLVALVGRVWAQPGEPVVVLLAVQGPITPVVQGYLERGVQQAQTRGAMALLVELDTPGGAVPVMERIVQAFRASTVPVIVYVTPAGATAASAGTFLVLAAHAAGMAPQTTIGAASPVGGGGEDLPRTAQTKAEELLAAMARSLAERRGPQAVEWAQRAVTQAAAATAQEALGLGLVDAVAAQREELLGQLHGLEVEVAGERRRLELVGPALVVMPMNPLERFLHTITDPNVALILMVLGVNGLLFELANPGSILPGVVGALALLLGLYATGVLSADYTGLVFLVLAFVLFVVDLFAPTHGILTLGGILSLVLGASMLFNTPYAQVSLAVVVGLAAATGGFFAFALGHALRAQRRRPRTGREGLLGARGVARSSLRPRGKVFLLGELWDAVAEDGRVEQGSGVEVVAVEGFTLRVRALVQE